MVDSVRCPNCGALVAADARWCGQCYSALGQALEGPAPSEPAKEPKDELIDLESVVDWTEVQPDGAEEAVTAGAPAAARPAAATGIDAGLSIRRVGEKLIWDCPACDTPNPIEVSMCSSCGTPFGRLLAEKDREQRRTLTPQQGLGYSLLLPGLGHMLQGRAPDGVARLILFLWAVGLGVVMLLSPSNSGPILGVGAVFVLSALAIWASTGFDSMRLASGSEEQVVTPKILLVGTVALTLLSIGAFLAAPRIGA